MAELRDLNGNRYLNLDKTVSYLRLSSLALESVDLKNELLSRVDSYCISSNSLRFSYAASLVNQPILESLQHLADEQKVIERYRRILAGECMNTSENRPVLHHQTRSGVSGFYRDELDRVESWIETVPKTVKAVVQVGIGGSHLGPLSVYVALKDAGANPCLDAHFISNIDPSDAEDVLGKIDFFSTMFVLVSKSGTTAETLSNREAIYRHGRSLGLEDSAIDNQVVVVTGKGSSLDIPSKFKEVFHVDDGIGGRFSCCSVVGAVVLALVFGMGVVRAFHKGAAMIDRNAENKNIYKNISLMSALIGVWERNFLGMNSTALIPYSSAMQYFPAHILQLDCESNGKSVNIYSEPIDYQTGPMVIGGVGSDCQHAFFQKFHQGTDKIPVQFIGFKNPQNRFFDNKECHRGQANLNASMMAQIAALATGRDHDMPEKVFSGNRPSTLLFADQLTPEVLGAILAYYENRVMFQGFLWNVNSFDQEGVELGKVLASRFLSNQYCNDIGSKGVDAYWNWAFNII